MDASIQSQILQNCGDVYRKENESSYYIILPESCEISFDEAVLKSAIADLKSNQEIVQELSFHLTVIRSILSSVENAVDIASLTLAKLNEQQP
jgi:transcription initiation factor IIE alpha subunit